MPVFHSSNLVYRKILVSPSGEICISFPKVAKNWPNRSGKWWNCKKILSFYPWISGFHAPRKVLGMYIYIWVEHVQQHKVALLVNPSISSLPFEWMRSSEFSLSGFVLARHLPKPLSKSCHWQSQFHLSLKHIFEAAGLCVARTHVMYEASVCVLRLSYSDPIGPNRPS